MNEQFDPRQCVYATVTPSPDALPRQGRRDYARYGSIHLFKNLGGAAGSNEAMVLGRADPVELFAHVDAFFGTSRERGDCRVTVDAEAAPEVDAALRSRGWRLDEEEPALVLQPLAGLAIPAPPPELAVRQVATEADLTAFRAMSPARAIPSLAAATAPGVALFVGSVDGVAVATSRAKVQREAPRVVDINGVTTRPEFRHRGYGTAMTWQTVRFGAALNADAAVVCASAMGYPVYVKMGFVPVCTFRTFAPPDDVNASA
jgi:Acetyltransferase (GNAT) family